MADPRPPRPYDCEDVCSTVLALTHAVQTQLIRAALQGGITKDTRRHMQAQLKDASDKLNRMPER